MDDKCNQLIDEFKLLDDLLDEDLKSKYIKFKKNL